MNNLDKIIESTQKAVLESGKSFDKIDKSSLLKYLENRGISNGALRESVYQKLSELNRVVAKPIETKVHKTAQSVDSAGKQPRKSVFGEIKRVV